MAMFEMQLTGIKEAKTMLSKELFHKVLSKTVGDTAYDARKDLTDELKKTFDRPTPFITRSVMVIHKKYDPSGLSALIGFFGTGGKRRGPEDVLEPHIKGGERKMKPSEERLYNYWIPGNVIKLNKYGNISGGLMTQILSYLRLLSSGVGYMGNLTTESWERKKKIKDKAKREKKLRKFFIVGWHNRTGKAAGVWEKLSNGKIRPILLFIRNPRYRKRLDFFGIIQRSINKNIQREFNNAFKTYISTRPTGP